MAATPKTTTWPLEPHTRAKHEILRRYLEAWTPIMSLGGFPQIAYVDGFAGPGVYAGGEDGSPIIALKSALQHKDRLTATLLFLFIEEDKARAAKLSSTVGAITRPRNFRVKVVNTTFEKGFRENLLDFYRKKRKAIPPTFAFIDPFGWTDVPFALIKDILAQPGCEVLINFMFEEINRFITHNQQEKNFDVLFGTSAWRAIATATDRKQFLHDIYVSQLRGVAKYVRSFEMRNDKDVTDYFLFFATNSVKGIKKMKEAMWKVDQTGEFRFSDATNPQQTVLFAAKPDYARLQRDIVKQFAGKETTVGEVEEFVLAETPFRETHYKKDVLGVLERTAPPGVIVVDPKPGRRAGTFADAKMRLRFAAA